MIEVSPLHGKYETPIDRRSAYEVLQARAIAAVEDAEKVEKYLEDERPEVRDFNAGRRYSGLRVGRAQHDRAPVRILLDKPYLKPLSKK